MELIMQAAEALNDHMKRTHGLTYTQFKALVVIADAGGLVTIGHLANAAGVAVSSTTAIVDTLERDEWAKRVRSKEDRRVVLVELVRPHDLKRIRDAVAELTKTMPAGMAVYLKAIITAYGADKEAQSA